MTFKSKNTKLLYTIFVTTLTLLSIVSCKTQKYNTFLVEGKKIEVNQNYLKNESIEAFITPYRNHIDKDLDSVISYSPEILDKSKGEFESNLGHFISDAALEMVSPIFKTRYNKNIDFCFTNNGGIRSIIPKGNITKRTAFEVMPFENSMVVVALKGDKVMELVEFYLKDKKPHPFSGMTIYLNEEMKLQTININNKILDLSKIYYVLTNDYVANGGDNMTFFLKNEGVFNLDYKFRNVLIDYFLKHNTLEISKNARINVLIEQ
jgi:2',3'-cyclic-nucleotide 2'-phosphodiesterase (5'-nucleotidase family)